MRAGIRSALMFWTVVACAAGGLPSFALAQETKSVQAAESDADGAADPAVELDLRRKETAVELETLSNSISISDAKIEELDAEVAKLEVSREQMREALVQSAAKRREIEEDISKGESALTSLKGKEARIRSSLHQRRGLLAEVLAALQRMGRNPPPAILVRPEDALGSVRSAILLGAVVPGMREEMEKLASDLTALAETKVSIEENRSALKALMTSRLEEEKRLNLLLEKNREQAALSNRMLEEERKRSEELAAKAGSMQDLIASLESEISSVRAAAETAARVEAERQEKEALDNQSPVAAPPVPDKNRIVPAYAFAGLKGKLVLPIAGEVIRNYGDPDGVGRTAEGVTVSSTAGAFVTAPADGWVVYAGSFRSYGQMVIMNMGEEYHLVMTGMEGVNVRPGQFVVAGEPVGTMGAKRLASAAALTLETDRPTLYIEIRHGGKPIDSSQWWEASKTGKASNDT